MMLATQTKLYFIRLLIGLSLSALVGATDIFTKQYNVTAAQNEYDSARADLNALIGEVAAQEKRVSQEQARLKEMRKKLPAAKERVMKAKTKLQIDQQEIDRSFKNE